ncbi:MAG TPA: hypothetical protein QF409_11440, partial [Acidimicrobiales bacterium]|nr:hypothetical protein [Acidimicrobiales bacterium]
MPYASSLSTHHDPGIAIGETIGEVLEVLGPSPDAVALFVSGDFLSHAENFLAATQNLLQPAALIGATAVSVISGSREVEDQGAVALWGGRFAGTASTVRLDAHRLSGGA